MKILVLPISGGSFPVQLAIMMDLANLSYKPDVTLACSGGNLAAYIASAADWSAAAITRIVKLLNSALVIKSWWPNWLSFMPSWLIGYFKGSVYKTVNGSMNLFDIIFSPATISRYEIWTATYNCDLGKAEIFCNKSRSESILTDKITKNNKICDLQVHGCLPITYLDFFGNREDDNDQHTTPINQVLDWKQKEEYIKIRKLAQITLASGSIPTLVPCQSIDNCNYVDGGLVFSSPLSALRKQILHMSQREKIHLTYISSFDIEACKKEVYTNNLLNRGRNTVSEMVRSLCLQDRLSAIDLVEFDYIYEEGVCDCKIMAKMEIDRMNYSVSVIEYYPNGNKSVDLTNFGPEDILTLINETRYGYRYRSWIKKLKL